MKLSEQIVRLLRPTHF